MSIDQQTQQRTQFFDRLDNKPFWIWDIEQHKQLDIQSNHESVGPEKPWFMWLAFGACHAPHHVPNEIF